MGIDGVTLNARATGFWGVGPPLSYWSPDGPNEGLLLIAADPLVVWLIQELIGEGTTFGRRLSPSHPGTLPVEWNDARFWEGWTDIVLLSEEASDHLARQVRELGIPGLRETFPHGARSWAQLLRSGISLPDFRARVDQAAPVETVVGAQSDLEGDFDFVPVEVGSAYCGGSMYYPYRVEERRLEALGSGRGTRKILVQGYATRVLRSDGQILTVETLPAPADARPEERVLALSDGTRIVREPDVADASSWSFSSIKAYAACPEPFGKLFRPLDLLAADLEICLRGRVWLPRDDDYALLTAYVLMTFVYPVFEAVPILLIQGERASGKTELGMALAELSRNGIVAGQMTAAGLARLVDEARGLVVLDDLESISTPSGGFTEIGQMLKTGYKKSSGRKAVVDRAGRVRTLDFFGPKAVSNTRGVEPVIRSRSVIVSTAAMP